MNGSAGGPGGSGRRPFRLGIRRHVEKATETPTTTTIAKIDNALGVARSMVGLFGLRIFWEEREKHNGSEQCYVTYLMLPALMHYSTFDYRYLSDLPQVSGYHHQF